MQSLCVFCGSSPGAGDEYLNVARAMGRLLARRGITLIYGGGSVGLMGAIANATLREGGRAVGVIP
ncbi:MAG TPA: TIGR00730 family Rossman fold protein, partial [Patescibacteria group bacterium]|nr:TIGR00730 family Rossman fold protein [Patescibacteria group bacterium]